jgi:AhpD family alkylhydroperoxidase
MTERGFTDLAAADASPDARAILDDTRAQFGAVPKAVARMAHAPALFHAFMAGVAAFDATSLTAVEREVVILVLARDVGCRTCVAMHGHIATKLGAGDIAAMLADRATLADARLEALARFTAAVVATRGDVDRATWEGFLAAGYSRAQALEVVLGVGTYTLSTFANRLTNS